MEVVEKFDSPGKFPEKTQLVMPIQAKNAEMSGEGSHNSQPLGNMVKLYNFKCFYFE